MTIGKEIPVLHLLPFYSLYSYLGLLSVLLYEMIMCLNTIV